MQVIERLLAVAKQGVKRGDIWLILVGVGMDACHSVCVCVV